MVRAAPFMSAVPFIILLNSLQTSSLGANKIVLALFALEMGASAFVVGALAALFSLAAATLSVPVGKLADRFGARWLLMGGAAGAGTGMLMVHFLPALPAVLVGGALAGLSQACFNVTLQNLTGLHSTPDSRARNFSNYSLTMSGGALVGPLLGGFMFEHIGGVMSCLFLGLLTYVPLVMLALRRGTMEQGALHKPEPALADAGALPTSTAGIGGTLALFRDRKVRETIISASFLSSGLNMMSTYMPVYGHSIGLSASVIGIVVAMNATAAFVIRALLPRMVAILKEEKVLALSFCFGATALLLVPFFTNAVVLGMLAFCFGLGMGAGQPVVTMRIFHFAPPGRSGEAIGLKITTNHLTNMVSPLLFGGFATALGLGPMFWLNGLMMVAGGGISWPRKKKPGKT